MRFPCSRYPRQGGSRFRHETVISAAHRLRDVGRVGPDAPVFPGTLGPPPPRRAKVTDSRHNGHELSRPAPVEHLDQIWIVRRS
jgi:hypothetical protein